MATYLKTGVDANAIEAEVREEARKDQEKKAKDKLRELYKNLLAAERVVAGIHAQIADCKAQIADGTL